MPYARDDLRFQFLITVIIFVSGAINPTAAALAETASGPEGGLVHEVALDPQDPDILYAATGSGGVFKSLDSGATWNPAKSGLYDLGVYDLVASADPPHLLAATGWGVYVSDNGGAEWSRYGNIPGGWEVWAVVRDPVDSSRVYAGSFGGGVFVTTDDGTTWIPHNTGLVGSGIVQLVVDPLTSALFAVTSSGGVFKTTDGASNWVQVGDGSVRDVVYLAIDPIDSSTLYAGTQCRGVFKSTDSGASWSLVNTGLGTPCGLSLLIDPDVPATIYAATRENGLFKSADGGASWYPSNSGLTTARLRELTIDASGDLYLATWGAGVFVSADEGDSWTATNDGLVATVVWTMARTSTTPETIFAGTLGARIFSTDNGGATWMSRSTGLPEAEIWALEAEPGDPMILYAGLNGAGVYQSTDGGLTWSSTGLGGQIWGFAISPASPSVVYVASQTGGAYRSDDRGDSWIHLTPAGPDNATEIAVDPTDASIVYLGTPFEGVFKSTDSGATWFSINEGLTDLDVRSLLIDPADPSVVYAGTMWTGVFKSADGGLNWTRPDPDFWGTIASLALDPATGDVYAAERFEPYSVHRSTDGGTTWEPVEGISHHAGTAVEVEVGPPARIYLGTDGGGVFVLESTGSEPCAPILGVNTLPSEDPQTWVNGLEVQLNGAVVPRPGCPPIAEVIWDWGDGEASPSWFPASHRYPAPGEYLLTVTAYDTEGASATAQQTLNLLNVAPMAFDQSLSVAEGGSVEITLSATDPDGPVELLTYSIAGEPAHGTVSVDPCCPGWLVTYAPDPDFFGPDSFTFVAIDPFGSSSVATVSIEVIPTLHLTGVSPQRNALGIDPATRVSASFDAPVDPSTVSESTVTVWGQQTGFYEGALSVVGGEVEFESDLTFKPGETVLTTLTSGLSGTTAAPLDPPFTWQFTTAVDPSAGRFMDSGQELGGSSSWAVALGDVDGDGDLDAWVGSYNGQPNRLWINNGAGSYSDSGQALGNSSTLAVALGDVDDDGDLDAWAANVSGRPDRLWLNDGAGGFADSGQALGNTDSRAVALGDLDGDGDLDAWVGNWSGQPDRVWLNDGGGGFTDSGQLLGTSYSLGIALGDVDGDGDLDSWVANFSSQSDKVWLNSGTGIFTDSGQALGNSLSRAVVLGDMDDDGDLDAWVGNWSDQPNRMWLNDGDGGFSDSGQLLGNSTSWAVALGDVDGDGDLDVWVANRLQPLRLWLNDGAGGFTDSGQDLGDSTTQALALGDVDGDGDLDAWVGQDNLPDRVWINNLAPVAEGDVFTTPENTPLTASVLGNDVDLDGDPLTVSLVTGVTHGSLSLSPDGSVTYTPDFGYFGSDEFTYEANDGRSNSNVATVTIDVLEVVNGAPVAFDQSLSVAEDGSVEITLSAADPDGPAELLTYSIVAEPAHGTVTVDPCCSGSLVTYAPNPNYVGPDSFTFIAVDPFGAVGEAAVSIEVTSALYVMAASPSPNAIDIGSAAVVIATFNSDVDAATIDGSTVTIWGHQTGFLGGAYSVSGSEVDFTPALAFKPGETVMTTLTSGVGGMSGANLDPPYTWQFTTAVDPSAGNFMESGQAIGSIDTLAIALGDFDSDGDLDAWLANNSGPDEVWLNDGAGTFLDSGQEIGVSYSLSIALGDVDNDGDLDVWTGSLDAWAETWGSHLWINDGSGSFTESDQYLGYGDAHGVEFGDVDGDGDLDAVVAYLSQPCQVWRNNGVGGFGESGESLGTRSRDVALGDLDGDGDLDAWVSYQDSYDELWPDRIWFNNGSGNFSESSQDLAFSGNRVALGDVDGDADLDAWVGLGREPGQLWLNDGRGGFTNSGQSLGSSGGSYVELGDVDGDGDLDAWAGGGTDPDFRLWLNDGDGVFTEEPPSPGDFYGGPIALGDLDGDGDLDALFLELISTQGRIWFNNAEPVTSDDLFTISEDTTLTASVLDNDVDLDGDALTVTLVTGVTHGSLSLSPDGSFTYTPAPEFFGTDSFTYQVSDGPSTSDIATVTIEIEPVNDPPMVSIQPPGDVPEGEEFTLTAQVSDSDDEVVSLRWDWGNGDTLTGTPAEMEQVVYAYCEGLHTVTLTATDESGDQGTASLVLDIWKRPILLGPLVFSENPAPAMTPVSLTTTVYGSADARGQACETVTVEFDWQDGQVDELVVTPGWGAEISAEHVYEPVEQETNYPVGVTVLGLGGQISGKTITITPESWGTDPGTDVVVEPIDPGTGEGVVRVIFEEVTEAGVTSGTATSTDQTPMPPGTNFQLMGGVYIDVHTTAQWAGSVQICLHYGGFEVDEGHLSIGHLVQNEPGFPRVWVNITDPDNPPENPNPDLVNKIICGTADSLSFFALFESIEMAAPLEPIQLGTPTNVSVQLTDPTTSDSAEWSWGDGEVTSGVYTSDGVEGTYVHSTPGVYPVGLTLLQGSSEVGSAEHRYVVVYDPDGGFVTGGGWIESPAGAYTPDPALTGRGNFGFVAKYKKGAQVPIGNTEFQFKVAHLDFKSTTYQWLVVAGAKAKFKGDGTINGEGDYGFMLSAIDGALPGGQGEDKFRIKIWDKDNGDVVVYDNELDAEDDADPTTIIGGGSIVIHKSK